MEKYGDLQNEGTTVTIVAGQHKGKQGIVKAAADGQLTIQSDGGATVTVDETAVVAKE